MLYLSRARAAAPARASAETWTLSFSCLALYMLCYYFSPEDYIPVLEAFPYLAEIRLQAPNKHHFLYDLDRFGIANRGEVFHADDRPYGLMHVTVQREDAPDAGSGQVVVAQVDAQVAGRQVGRDGDDVVPAAPGSVIDEAERGAAVLHVDGVDQALAHQLVALDLDGLAAPDHRQH